MRRRPVESARRAGGRGRRRGGGRAAGGGGIAARRAFALVLGAALAAACTLPATVRAGDGSLPDNPLRGRLLFEARHCNRCHGVSPDEAGPGPNLDAGRFRGTFFDLGAALWNHVPDMSVAFMSARLPWPELTEEEAVELLAFLYYLDYLGRPGRADAGSRLFNTKGCAACHSIGDDGKEIGPDLAELRRFASPLYIAQAIWNHSPSMFESMHEMNVAPPTFAEGELADLSAYIRQQGGPGPRERMLLAPGNPNRGGEVFAAKGCATCHGDGARGGSSAPDLRTPGLRRSAEAIAGTMWNHALAMGASMRERGVEWPEFTTVELADLIAFLYFLDFDARRGDPGRGRAIFTDRCAECHAAGGESVHRGPDLAAASAAAGSAATLVAAMWNHAPIMREAILSAGRPWPGLTGDDLQHLLAYLTGSGRAP